MSQVDDILNSLEVSTHEHDVIDTDKSFTIDPFTRNIIANSGQKTIIIQGDHNSERFTFTMPRYVEGHDMALCNLIYVPYINSETKEKDNKFKTGVYPVDDLTINADDETVTFSWLISGNATKYEGVTTFSVLFSCVTGKRVDYRWGTNFYEELYVLKSLDSELSFENEYVEVIEAWKEAVKAEFAEFIDIKLQEYVAIAKDELNVNLTDYLNGHIEIFNNKINTFDEILRTEITKMDNDIDVLKSRMDTFTSLPEGSTAGDAELADIKVGFNGKIYNNPGTAVREQIASAINENRSIYADTDNLINRHTLSVGYLKDTDGTLIDNDTYFKQYTTTDFIAVIAGSEYDVLVPQGNACNRIVFFTTPDIADSYVDFADNLTERTITIPENVTYIRMSYYNTSAIQPAHVSIVHSGDDTSMLMRGIVDYNMVEHKVHVTDDNELKPETISGFKRISNNMFNKYDVVDNKFLKTDMKWLDTDVFATFFTSGYISVESGETYTISPIWSVMYFDKYYRLVGYSEEVSHKALTVVIPDDAVYIRFKALMSNKDVVMMNKGNTVLPYEKYIATYGFLPDFQKKRLYTLREAMCKWYSGEKFDIGFLGDSTTDGMGTSEGGGHQTADTNAGGWGYADYINTKAYPYKLEKLIHNAVENNKARIYNIGYSGTKFDSLIPYYDDIFGHVYSNVKMVGIVMGINDRLVSDRSKYYKNFREDLIYTVEYLYSKGIQPFMVTSQATLESHCEDEFDDTIYPLRDAESINTIANGIKKEVAEEYNLEIIDLNAYDEFMINYSQIPVSDICTDKLHFKDAGHTFEAEYLYAYISGRCIDVKPGDILSYASQRMRSDYPSNRLKYFDRTANGFKIYAEHNRDNTDDIVLQDFIINVVNNSPITLKTYCSSVNGQYILIDDVVYDVTSEIMDIKDIDVGIHRVVVMSGNSNSINWIGIKIVE